MQEPFVLIIFGATGDLAKNKLYPSLFQLYQHKQLGQKFYIVGFSRRSLTDDEFRGEIHEDAIIERKDHDAWKAFLSHFHYQQGMFEEKDGYENLISHLHGFDTSSNSQVKRIFYLATAPDKYDRILDLLERTKLAKGHGDSKPRIVVEKPFGKDLETAKGLDAKLSEIFEEKEIFRVDHYLGKETVQNILAFRFANNIFEPVWKSEYIDHVQITWSEKKGISGRGKFFDGVGLLRDVGQNHLMQLLAAIIMEQPKSFSKEGVRDVRASAIKAIQYIEPKDVSSHVVRGQYKGYKDEKGIEKDSKTETFVALKLFVKTPRFAGVPFYLRAGKKMPKNHVSISVVFKQTCHILFRELGCPEVGNVLTFHIQPDEGITIRVVAKRPSTRLALVPVDMHLWYKEAFGRMGVEAYEKILLDILTGDQMLFNRSDELDSSWEFITKILTGWQKQQEKTLTYSEGQWGPKEANELIEKDSREWLTFK